MMLAGGRFAHTKSLSDPLECLISLEKECS
jgi:hypothetical protein